MKSQKFPFAEDTPSFIRGTEILSGWIFLYLPKQKGSGGKRKCFATVSFELINEFNDGKLFHRPVCRNNVYGK